jgi:spermidine synthase
VSEPQRPSEGQNFGRHVIVDAWAINEDGTINQDAARVLNDPVALSAALNELVTLVGMQILRPADVLHVELDPDLAEGGDDCGGVTGTVILTTSHGSIHTWPLRGQVSFDLFSCKDFDSKAVFDYLRIKLHLTGGVFRSMERSHNVRYQREFVDVSVTQRV